MAYSHMQDSSARFGSHRSGGFAMLLQTTGLQNLAPRLGFRGLGFGV